MWEAFTLWKLLVAISFNFYYIVKLQIKPEYSKFLGIYFQKSYQHFINN
jgi:hypothetical protein